MWLQILICIVVAFVAYVSLPPGEPLTDFLYKWQTLLAAGIALFAARLTVQKISIQIRQVEEHHEDIRNRKFDAARAVMSFTLSQLCEYAETSLRYTIMANKEFIEKNDITEEIPPLPDNIILTLRDLIEHADAETTVSLHNLISCIQIHRSRMRFLPRSKTPQPGYLVMGDNPQKQFAWALRDTAALHVIASAFFEYARKKTNTPPNKPINDEIREMINKFKVDLSEFPEFKRVL